MKRIAEKFKELKTQKKCAFVGYICAGDPTYEISLEVLKALPKAGCDIIELGIPFLDPAGDGPTIESAAKRAVTNGTDLKKVLKMAEEFRKTDGKTPLILMTYYNPLLKYGLDKIFVDAEKSGADGFLIVDLPLEEEQEIKEHISRTNLDLIGLIAPTTSKERAKKIAANHSGFLYLISMLGITGTKSADLNNSEDNLYELRGVSDIPIVIGFGIKTYSQAKEVYKMGADGVVVGSAIVKEINENFVAKKSTAEIVNAVIKKVRSFHEGD